MEIEMQSIRCRVDAKPIFRHARRAALINCIQSGLPGVAQKKSLIGYCVASSEKGNGRGLFRFAARETRNFLLVEKIVFFFRLHGRKCTQNIKNLNFFLQKFTEPENSQCVYEKSFRSTLFEKRKCNL